MYIRIISTVLQNYEADILRKDLIAFLYFRSVKFHRSSSRYKINMFRYSSILSGGSKTASSYVQSPFR